MRVRIVAFFVTTALTIGVATSLKRLHASLILPRSDLGRCSKTINMSSSGSFLTLKS
jgi:hypothetical protein